MTQLIIVGCYLTLLLCLGLFSSRLFKGTSEDYMLASHSIGPVLLLMSLFGTTMTAFALVGSTGESFKEGIGVYGQLASSSGIVHSACFFLFGVRLWSFGHRFGYRTQIQFFRDRLQSDVVGIMLFPVIVGLVIPYLLIGVMGSGSVISGVTVGAFPEVFSDTGGAVPAWIASLVICIVVLTYVFFGGMRGTAWANTFQTAVFMVLGVISFVVIANRLGGSDSLLENLRIASSHVATDKLDRSHMEKTIFATYLLVPLSVGMFPHIFQHWLTARSASAFKLPVVAHPIFIMIVWVPCVLVGVWATTDLIELPESLPPNAVLAFMVQKLAGSVLGGFLTAGILAAIMSSLDSQFLCIGTIFTEDIVVHYGGKDRFTERQTVLMARCFIVLIVAVTFGLSLIGTRRIFTLGVWCFSGYSSLTPLLFAALFWKRLNRWGAMAGIAAAFGSWLYLFADSGYAQNPKYAVYVPWFGESYPTMPVATMIVCSTVGMVAVTLLTPAPDKELVEKFFPSTPRKGAN